MGYLRQKDPRLLVLMALGLNRLNVKLCPGAVGRDLYDALRRGSDSHRMAFAEEGCPIIFNNRRAYGAAAGGLPPRRRHSRWRRQPGGAGGR